MSDRAYTSKDKAADRAETFPRPPSNEQTLLTELGQCKAELAEARKDAKENWDGWEESMKGHGECLRLCEQLTAERDALAVTAERQRLALLRLGRGIIGQQYMSDMTTDDWVRRIVADALLCTVEELGDDLAPRITEMLMAIEADRDEARRQLAEIKEIDAKMCADYSTMVEQLAEAREWIKRLSESLEWAVDVIEGNLDRKKYFGPERVNAARAILKETAPPA